MLSKFSKAIYVNLKYEDDHVFINLERVESWLAPSVDLDVVTPPVSMNDRSLYSCL
jgi:hypothetical protein